MLIIGCDYHPGFQQIALVDTETGEADLAHLLSVSALVIGEHGHLEFAVTEDMVVAALLHDAAEDQGGIAVLKEIECRFGPDVARIVNDCSDSLGIPKRFWHARKSAHLQELKNLALDSLLIITADKVDNCRAVLADYRSVGEQLWERFRRGKEGTLWYYNEMAEELTRLAPNRLTTELMRILAELNQAVGDEGPASARQPLSMTVLEPSATSESQPCQRASSRRQCSDAVEPSTKATPDVLGHELYRMGIASICEPVTFPEFERALMDAVRIGKIKKQ